MRPNRLKGSAVLVALATGIATAASPPAMAQTTAPVATAPRPSIRVAPVILAEPEVETSINVQIGPDGAVPRQTFLRVRGMPLAARLSDGHVVTPGIWAVPLASLPSLRLHAPLSSSGRTEIHFALVGVDGGVLAEAKSSLVVAPAWLLGSGTMRQDSVRVVPTVRLEPPPPPPPPAAAPPVRPASVAVTAPEPARSAPFIAPPPPAPVASSAPAPRQAAAPAPVVTQPAPSSAPRAAPPAPSPVTRPEPPAVVAALPPPPRTSAPSVAPASRPALPLPAATPPARQTAPAAGQAPVVPTAADRQRAETLVQRGDVFMRQGNVAAARQFYRRAADIGLATAALKMGATYDPTELAAQAVVGLVGDTKEAGLWYERARDLGAPEASARLSRLQSR